MWISVNKKYVLNRWRLEIRMEKHLHVMPHFKENCLGVDSFEFVGVERYFDLFVSSIIFTISSQYFTLFLDRFSSCLICTSNLPRLSPIDIVMEEWCERVSGGTRTALWACSTQYSWARCVLWSSYAGFWDCLDSDRRFFYFLLFLPFSHSFLQMD